MAIIGLSDLDFLYAYIITFENLRFCLFTSFAFIDNEDVLDLLSEMYFYKTGLKIESREILEYSLNTLNTEKGYEKKASLSGIRKSIPNFVKVLYRYFNSTHIKEA